MDHFIRLVIIRPVIGLLLIIVFIQVDHFLKELLKYFLCHQIDHLLSLNYYFGLKHLFIVIILIKVEESEFMVMIMAILLIMIILYLMLLYE